MSIPFNVRWTAYVALAGGVVLAAAAGSPAAPDGNRAAYRERLAGLAAELGRRTGASVVVDPEILPETAPSDPGPVSLAEALERLVAGLRGTAWRRITAPAPPAGAAPRLDAETAARLGATARALGRVPVEGIAVEDPAARKAVLWAKPPADLGPTGTPLERTVYLLYSTASTSDGKIPEERFTDLQAQQLGMMDRLPASRLANPMLQVMRMIQGQDPRVVEQRLSGFHLAGMRLWEGSSSEERDEMFRQTMGVAQTFGNGGGTGAGRGAAGPAAPPGGYLPDLKHIAAVLAHRYGVPVLVDPSIRLENRPASPRAGEPAERAFGALAAPHFGLAWRRVYLPQPLRDRLPAAPRLAAAARLLHSLPAGALRVEDVTARRTMHFLKRGDRPGLAAELGARGFSSRPIYLLYSVFEDDARGQTLEGRYADAQRRQFEMLFGMDAGQVERTLDGALRTWREADPASRGRLMGLPALAGLVAVWMPRAAKEAKARGEQP